MRPEEKYFQKMSRIILPDGVWTGLDNSMRRQSNRLQTASDRSQGRSRVIDLLSACSSTVQQRQPPRHRNKSIKYFNSITSPPPPHHEGYWREGETPAVARMYGRPWLWWRLLWEILDQTNLHPGQAGKTVTAS